MRKSLGIILVLLGLSVSFSSLHAAGLGQRLKGHILLDVQSKGEAWYVHPGTQKRHYLGRPADAFRVMREQGVGISEVDFANLKTGNALAKRLAGQIVLRVQKNGEAYYIHPVTTEGHYLGRPEDAFRVMSRQGLGISRADLKTIPEPSTSPTEKSTASTPPTTTSAHSFERKTVQTKQGNFTVDMITADLSQATLRSETASFNDCTSNCPAKTLKEYVADAGAFAGIHGAYFCPPDYASCEGKTNSYFYPFYKSATKRLINAGQIKWLQGAILVFDEKQQARLFPDGKDFVSQQAFEKKSKTKITALISNSPALIHNSVNISGSQTMDEKQRTAKSTRGGIGVKDGKVYLMIARGATVPDLAAIMESLGLESGLNLDGGGSSALYYDGGYKVGPGRLLPTAIVLSDK